MWTVHSFTDSLITPGSSLFFHGRSPRWTHVFVRVRQLNNACAETLIDNFNVYRIGNSSLTSTIDIYYSWSTVTEWDPGLWEITNAPCRFERRCIDLPFITWRPVSKPRQTRIQYAYVDVELLYRKHTGDMIHTSIYSDLTDLQIYSYTLGLNITDYFLTSGLVNYTNRNLSK